MFRKAFFFKSDLFYTLEENYEVFGSNPNKTEKISYVPKAFKKAISELEDALFTYPSSGTKKSLNLRCILFLLEDGNIEYLVTNLMPEQMTTANFPDLYRLRWWVESKYRELKNRLKVEAFNSVKPIVRIRVLINEIQISHHYSSTNQLLPQGKIIFRMGEEDFMRVIITFLYG